MAIRLDERHPDYLRNEPLWTYAADHYDDRALYEKLREYLPQKSQAEHQIEYDERRRLAEYENFCGPVIDSLVGLQFAKWAEIVWEWGALGDPMDPDSRAAQLLRNADGGGTDWKAQAKQIAADILVYQKVGVLIDSSRPTGSDGATVADAEAAGWRPYRHVLPPTAIINWISDERGRLREALVMETADTRETLDSEDGDAESVRYLWLTLDGWQRIRAGTSGIEVIEEGTYDYVDRSGQRVLPLVIGELPIRRYPAYTLARINNAIFNLDSGLSWQFRKAQFQRMVFTGTQEDFAAYEEKAKKAGVTAVLESYGSEQGGKGHRYIGPDMSAADKALELRDRLLRAFWDAAQFAFSDDAAQRTATEIRADFAASIGSIESTLAGALDEVDNASLHLLGQAWGLSPDQAADLKAKRPDDLTPEDTYATAERIKAVVFGEGVDLPIPSRVKANAMKRISRALGLMDDIDEDELELDLQRAAELADDRDALFRDALAAAATPPAGVVE